MGLDAYGLGAALGKSRVASTYAATERATGRPCVVKVLSLRQATGSHGDDVESLFGDDRVKLIEMFEREGRVLAGLDHPAIPKFMDAFVDESADDVRFVLVQEKIDAVDLGRLIKEGLRLHERQVVRVGIELCRVLEYLHGLSPPVVHRDIKPSNVLRAPDGRLYLIDFGAVKERLAGHEHAGATVVGTLGYMPLEQLEGRADARSDVYALGATLVFLLSHREPREMERRGLRLDFRPHVNVSPALADVLDRALHPEVARRYESAAAFRCALETTLEDRAPRSNQRLGFLAAAGVAVLAVGTALWLREPPEPKRPTVRQTARPTKAPPRPAPRPTGPEVKRTPWPATCPNTNVDAIERAPTLDALKTALAGGALCGVSKLYLTPRGVWGTPQSLEAWQALVASADLEDLRELYVERHPVDRRWAELVAGAPTLRALGSLDMNWMSLGDRGLAALAHSDVLLNVEHLYLGHSDVGAKGMMALAEGPGFSALRTLRLHVARIGDAGFAALIGAKRFHRFTNLSCFQCGLSDASAVALARSPSATTLGSIQLQDNRIGPEGARALASAGFGNLVSVDLGNNPLGAEGARALAQASWPKPTYVNLISSGLGDAGLAALVTSGRLDGVRDLALGGNGIGDVGVRTLAGRAGLAGLRSVSLDNNAITDEGARALAESPHLAALAELTVYGNAIGNTGLAALEKRFSSRVRTENQRAR